MQIDVTEKARRELQKLDFSDGRFLRIAVVPGGCSGMTYNAALDTDMRPEDQVLYKDDAIRVVADGGSAMFLDGLKVDYSSDLIKSGFRFISPKSVKSCGCGASFAA